MSRFTKSYYVADFETTPLKNYELEGRTRVFMWYYENIFKDSDNDIGMNISDFWKSLQVPKYKKEHKIIYFHNLDFDVLFLEYFLIENGYVQSLDRLKNPMYRTYTVLRDQYKTTYQLIVYEKNNLKIEFRDSYKLLQSSVDRLPSIDGVEKLKDFDYNKLRDEMSINDFSNDEIEYIKNDVRKVKNVLKGLMSHFGDSLTIASNSFADWRKNFFNKTDKHNYKDTFYEIETDIKTILRKSYNGGLTILNEQYREKMIDEPVLTFDVNSMYPYVMKNYPMPVGKPSVLIDSQREKMLKRFGYNLFIYCVVVKSMRIKHGYHAYITDEKHYQYRYKKTYYNEINDTVFYWTNVDLQDVLKYYDIDYEIDYNLSYGFKSRDDIFTDYIDFYYNMKENAKTVFDYMLSKYRLNTVYGKFGTRDIVVSMESVLNDEGRIEFVASAEEQGKNYYLPVAVFITSYARHILTTAIQDEREGFIYCDTDSLHVIKSKYKNTLTVDDNKLGAWSLENESSKSLYYSNKQYLLTIDGEIKRTVAGMTRTRHHLVNFDNMYKGSVIENGRLMRKHVKGGYLLVDSPFTFT